MRTIVHNRTAVASNVTTFATLSTIQKYLVMPLFMIAAFFMCSQSVNGQSASALQFDGIQHVLNTTDYVSVNSPFTAFNKEITVEYWMYTPSANMPFGRVMGRGTSKVDSVTRI